MFCIHLRVDAGLTAESSPGPRMQTHVWVCDNGRSSQCIDFFLTDGISRGNGRRLKVASTQAIPILDIGYIRIAFALLGEDRPLCVVQPTDALYISDF